MSRPTSPYTYAAAVCLAVGVNSSPARSQGYPPSQRGSVTQNVAFTEISVVYGRPVARGRELFGALVPWDRIWHPGADSATRVRFNHDVLIEGKPLAAGEYSLWLIPHESAAWTLIFSRAAHVFHLPYPGESFDVLRVDVTPEQASPMESFAIYFPKVLRDDAVMRLHWGTTALPIQIKAPFRPISVEWQAPIPGRRTDPPRPRYQPTVAGGNQKSRLVPWPPHPWMNVSSSLDGQRGSRLRPTTPPE